MAETEVVSFLRELSGEQFDVAAWTREEPDPALRDRIVAYVQQAVAQRLLDRDVVVPAVHPRLRDT